MRFINPSMVIVILSLCSSSHSFAPHNATTTTASLDHLLEDLALGVLIKHHGTRTGALYAPHLPADLTGIRVLIIRLRGRRLWANGVNLGEIQIPPKTIPVPHVKRLAIVYQNLGNRSRHYYSIPGYRLLTSVVGFEVLDLSETKIFMDRNGAKVNVTRKIHLHMAKPIAIRFKGLGNPSAEGMLSSARCVAFTGREYHISRMQFWGVCNASKQGHFSVIVPKMGKEQGKKFKHFHLWLVGCVLGFGGLMGLLGYLRVLIIRVLQTKKIQAMEKQADEGVVFADRWVGITKVPSASVTRTPPALENFEFS